MPFATFVPSIKIKPSELGPGLLLAATGIGVGDMVSSTIAGASYGLTLVWALAAGVLVKLAITEGGARWQLATGSTLVEGWREHLPSSVLLAFFIYFVIWSYAVSSALVAASALVPAAVFPQVPLWVWGLLQAVVALAMVYYGRYERFLTILGVPSSVLAGVVGAHFAPRLWPRGKVLLGTAAALYVGLNGALLEANTRFWGSPVPDIKIAFERIRQSGCPETIYVVDEIWRMRGHVLLRFSPPRPHRLEVLPRGDLSGLRGACVIVDGSYFNGIAPDQLDPAAFDARLFEPARRPPTWKRLFVQKLGARDPSRSSTVEAIQLR